MIDLDDDVRLRLAHAIDKQKTLTVAYVDKEGKPHISFYGSTHVHSADQLANLGAKPGRCVVAEAVGTAGHGIHLR